MKAHVTEFDGYVEREWEFYEENGEQYAKSRCCMGIGAHHIVPDTLKIEMGQPIRFEAYTGFDGKTYRFNTLSCVTEITG